MKFNKLISFSVFLAALLLAGWILFRTSPLIEPNQAPDNPLAQNGTANTPGFVEVAGFIASASGETEKETPAAPPEGPWDPEENVRHDHLKRRIPLELNPGLRELANQFQDDPDNITLILPAFDGEDLRLIIQELRPHNDRAAAMTGTVKGMEMSFFSLSYVGDAETGSIHLPARGQVFEFHKGSDDVLYLNEVDVAALGRCGSCLPEVP